MIFKIFKKSKYYILPIFFIVVFVFFPTHFALADDSIVARFISLIIEGLIYFVGWFVTRLIEILNLVFKYQDFDVAGVSMGWAVARDVANSFFILILLLIAFATILRIENYSMKRYLPKLIMIAVVINFSKMISLLLIDVSQAIMMPFVVQFVGNGSNFIHVLNLDKFNDLSGNSTCGVDDWGIMSAMLLSLFFLVVSFFVIIMMIGILLARVIAFWILIVLSPLAFLAYAVPGGASYFSRWWSEFVKYLTVGPVLAFFMWLSFAVLETGSSIFGNNNAFKSANGSNVSCLKGFTEIANFANMSSFVVAVALLIGAMKVTQSLGAIGGGFGMNMAMGLKNKGTGVLKSFGARKARQIGRKAGSVGLGAVASVTSGMKKDGYFGAVHTMTKKWSTDLKKKNAEERRDARIKTLRKLGMSDDTIDAYVDVSDKYSKSKFGKGVNMTKKAAMTVAGASLGMSAFSALGAISPTMQIAGSGLGGSFVGTKVGSFFRNRKLKKAKEEKESKDEAAKRERDAFFNSSEHKRYEEDRDRKINKAADKRDDALGRLENSYRGRAKDKNYRDTKKRINNVYEIEKRNANREYERKIEPEKEKYRNALKRNQEEYDKKVNKGLANQIAKALHGHDNKYEHSNQVTRDAVEHVNKAKKTGQQRVDVLANGEDGFHEVPKNIYYSNMGQTDVQRAFFKQLNNGDAQSLKALNQIEDTLNKILRNEIKPGKKELEAIEAFKMGTAAFMKSGGELSSKMQEVVAKADNVHTGDGSKKRHTATVEEMKDLIVDKV